MAQGTTHKYTIGTPHGDVNLTTPYHHSGYDTLREFLEDHHDRIMEAVGVTSLALTSLSIWLSHGRGGTRLK